MFSNLISSGTALRSGIAALIATQLACSPSDPKLSYAGIDAVSAIILLDKAQSSQEREIVITKLQNDRRVGFDWEYFWKNLPDHQRFNKLDPSQQERTLSLSADSCSVQGFQQFGEFVLKIQSGFAFVTGQKRVCAQALSADLFARYVKFFSGRVWTSASTAVLPLGEASNVQELARLIISQVQTDGRTDKSPVLQHLNADHWHGLIRRLLGIGSGDLAAQLVQINQAQYGSIKFVETLMLSWLNRPADFEKVLNMNALIDVARILAADPAFPFVSNSIDEVKWMKTLDLAGVKFAKENTTLNETKFEQALRTLDLLQTIPERAAHPPAFSEQLKWHERMLRTLEQGLTAETTGALLAVNTTSPQALWIKARLHGQLTVMEEGLVEDFTASSKLGQALIQRLKMRVAKSPKNLQERMTDYCSWLEAFDVKARHLNGDAFTWDLTLEPGCIHLEGNTDPTQIISATHDAPLNMAFDSLLFTGGWNLKLKTPRFDGSFIDLSTNLKHPDLPVEVTPQEDHAIAFPILMGITVRDDSVFSTGVGTYYFIYHHTWRKAHAGRAAEATPLPGFPGATLQLNVNHPGVDPSITAFGGPGQKGVPRRLGGNASDSKVLWFPLRYALARAEADPKGAQPVPTANPSVKTIDLLLKHGDKDENGNNHLLTENERLWRNLEEDQKQKALMACPGGIEDLACWETLTLQAAAALYSEYASLCPFKDAERICPPSKLEDIFARLNSSYFQEVQGILGPVNPDGPTGKDGGLLKEVAP